MKLFLSWSGPRSEAVALALRDWLPFLFESIEPWMSKTDIAAGARWGREIQDSLSATQVGIVCLTRANLKTPWILFETGALAKSVEDTYIVPYLIDLEPSDVPSGPLTQFQGKKADREGTWDVIKAINRALGDKRRDETKVRTIYERWWPDLERALSSLPADRLRRKAEERTVEEMVQEILLAVRSLERSMDLIRAGEPVSPATGIGRRDYLDPVLLATIFQKPELAEAIWAGLRASLEERERSKTPGPTPELPAVQEPPAHGVEASGNDEAAEKK